MPIRMYCHKERLPVPVPGFFVTHPQLLLVSRWYSIPQSHLQGTKFTSSYVFTRMQYLGLTCWTEGPNAMSNRCILIRPVTWTITKVAWLVISAPCLYSFVSRRPSRQAQTCLHAHLWAEGFQRNANKCPLRYCRLLNVLKVFLPRVGSWLRPAKAQTAIETLLSCCFPSGLERHSPSDWAFEEAFEKNCNIHIYVAPWNRWVQQCVSDTRRKQPIQCQGCQNNLEFKIQIEQSETVITRLVNNQLNITTLHWKPAAPHYAHQGRPF